MKIKYPKGAEWRKWDLHLHTPSSYDYGDKSVMDNDIIDVLATNEISVAAITDHHVMDVGRIKNLQELGQGKGITILPGIEILSDARASEPIHFIGIFPEDCKLEHIWGQIQNKTNISKMVGEEKKANEVYCELIKTTELIHELGGVVTIHSGKKHGSFEKITNSLAHAVAQKKDIAENVEIFELGRVKDQEGYKSIVFPAIDNVFPMVICSDNHNIKKYQLKAKCWIKADPNFLGLEQVINEPEERVFIGEKPPLLEKIATNRTKYMKQLAIKTVPGYAGTDGKWFDNINIPLNHELVAIIGNKGSGKSAVADIISLCSNYYSDKDFSFLSPNKFREKSGKIAKNFEAILTWESDKAYKKNLKDVPDATEVLTVKYIPQGRFERLTNEISTVEDFQKEIESVVFSHIPESERLNTKSFQELIDMKSSSVESELSTLKDDINDINKKIIALETKDTSSYRQELKNKIQKKKDELNALIEPKEVSDPNDDPEKKGKSETINQKIKEIKREIEGLQNQIIEAETQKKKALDDRQTLTTIKSGIEQKQVELKRFKENKKKELSDFKIDIEKLISLNIDFSEIDVLIAEKESQLGSAQILLGEKAGGKGYESLQDQLNEKKGALKKETAKLDTEQKIFQDYLADKAKWEQEQAKIVGSGDQTNTLEFYKAEVKYLDDDLNIDLDAKYEERNELTRVTFNKKQEVITVYKNARERLNEIIKKNSKTLKDYKIDVDAFLTTKSDFSARFLNYIDKNKKGSFYSQEGAEFQFKALSSEVNFDEEEDIISFLDSIMDALLKDKREKQNGEQRVISEQVKNIAELYNYLYSLDFLENNYQLKQGNKNLEQLSPGERGALLLVFYLLLDKSDIPLIIDQPEDNLDNHSVAKVLVPFIKMAKKKRQIIMVTHNPNLAVVADAEQVIYVELDKENEYEFSTVSGSIENREVNEKIVEVLEGAMPAFNTRKRKYYG
jgi:ABC-type lipoprotein export system ATPase subunit